MFKNLLRSIPPFPGKQRLARILLGGDIENSNDTIIRGKYGCSYKIPNAKENIGFEIFINGIYEQDTIDFIVAHIKPNSILMDLGSNIGAISIPVSKKREDIKVICVEAAPWLFEYLGFNMKLNNITNAHLLNKAISDVDNRKVQFYAPYEKFGKGSLSPVFTSDGVEVVTTTIDRLTEGYKAGEIGMIKIDVEGFELPAFRGGEKLLRSEYAPDIVFEFLDWAEIQSPDGKAGEAQALLLAYGYSIYDLTKDVIGDKLQAPVLTGTHMFFASKSYH